MKVYVITAPDQIRGIYDTWPACQAAFAGVKEARYQKVSSREKAEKMLSGEGVVLPPGVFAFTDGSGDGGVGVVVVEQKSDDEAEVVYEKGATVGEVFGGKHLAGLKNATEIARALADLKNILSEIAAAYYVLLEAKAESAFTIVHDYKGVAKWIDDEWNAESPIVETVIRECQRLIDEKKLNVLFQHQPGHQSTWAGRDDFAKWNGRADQLATKATADKR